MGRPVINLGQNTSNRGFCYVPAPPPETKSVTFGQIPNVPVE